MTQPLSDYARSHGIHYFLISFTDLFGVQRSKLVPTEAIDALATNGAGFAGFAAWLDMTPADPDVLALPDRERLFQLPWQPEVAWMPADLVGVDGMAIAQTPRGVLKQVLEQAKILGYQVKTGVECEYFLLAADDVEPRGLAIADPRDRQTKPCYDQQSLMRHYGVIREICDSMAKLGWGPYQNDHEDANGQFEMNWAYADALVTADRQAFFKYMVKAIAETHNLRATFMPKPFGHLTGNGCHVHLSVWDSTGETNLFLDGSGALGLSPLAYHFIAGVLDHGAALCAFTNPTVNSYKRLNAPVTDSGATWSPNTLSYSGNNRTHAIRIPEPGRFELRLADGAANPYLMAASVIAAGLEGMTQGLDPGPRYDTNTYTDPPTPGSVKTVPASLGQALEALQADSAIASRLGSPVVTAYLKLKGQEWQDYQHTLAAQISPWELDHTLDC